MTQALSIRIHLLAALILAIALLTAPFDATNTAFAKGKDKGKKGAVQKSAKDRSRKTASCRSSRRSRRSYTVRGNPEITKQVATNLLASKLPELAALVGIQAAPDTENASDVAATMMAKPVLPKPVIAKSGSYQDSELDDNEDQDGITEADYKSLQDLPTDINTFYKEFTKYMASLNGEPTITDNGIDKVAVMEALVDWIGTRYLFGGMGRNGIDCSAFTGTVYRSINFRLPRTAAAQWDVGNPVNREDLQFGDLVFFNTRKAVYVSHVGMYLGNGMFAHASSRNGVTVSSLDADYYSTHFIGARRYDLNAAFAAAGTADAASQN